MKYKIAMFLTFVILSLIHSLWVITLRRGEEMKAKLLKCIGLLIGLVFVFSMLPQSAAAVMWEDNFNDGTFEPEWTITAEYNNEWGITDYTLATDGTSPEAICRIWHESNVTVGTWSFDMLVPANGDGIPKVLFLANGTDPPGAFEDDYQGYGIEVWVDAGDIYLYKQDGDWDQGQQLLATAEIEVEFNSWAHYDITRNSTGGFNVYVDADPSVDEPHISYVHTEFSYSERFVLDVHWGNAMFDNFTVIDTVLGPIISTPTTTTTSTTTTTTTPTIPSGDMTTMLIIAGGGVVGIAIIAGVIFMRRR